MNFQWISFSLATLLSLALQVQAREALNDKTKRELLAVLEKNEALHQAFFSYKGPQVEEVSEGLLKAIRGISQEDIAKLLQFSSQKLSEIKASKTREENNQNYHLVSMALIHFINKYDLGPDYNAYSCPMVKKKWIQNTKKVAKVHNPYDPSMPHCGTQDTRH